MARELDPDEAAGADPTEERGPEEAESPTAECELRPGEYDAPPEGSQAEFVSELDEAYVPEPELCVPHPLDGLPAPAGEGGPLATAPPFTIDNLVCVEDDREYVEMWADEAAAWRERPDVDTPRGRVFAALRFDDHGNEHERRRFQPSEVERRWGWYVCKTPTVETMGSWPFRTSVKKYTAVRPVRERCKHYLCQMMNNDEVPDPTAFGHCIVFRNCAARRSVGGALMSLRDQAVYACDYRSPPDEKSAKEFDATQRARLRGNAHKQLVPFLQLKNKAG